MSSVKQHLHQLIDETPEGDFLFVIENIFEEQKRDSSIWDNLTAEQKKRVLDAEQSIEDADKLVSNMAMKDNNAKWLK